MKQFVQSVLLSIVASVVGTYLLRQLLLRTAGGSGPDSGQDGEPRPGGNANVNVNLVVMPIVIGNTHVFGNPSMLKRLKRRGRRR